MKSRILISLTAIALFAALATPTRLTAQMTRNTATSGPNHYTVQDLGTLGGTYSEAVGISNSGSEAGTSTPLGDAVVHASLWRNNVITDLGTLGGPNSIAPEAEPQPNEKGEVVGASDTTTPDPNGEDFCFFGTNLICLPFVWDKGVMSALPTLGGNNGTAWEVNNLGQVAGIAENGTFDPSCASSELEAEPVIWEKGTAQQLPTVSGDLDGTAFAISERGQAVGFTGDCNSEVPFTGFHAVLWQRGTNGWKSTDLGNLGGKQLNLAFGINNRGQVVGQSDLPGDTTFHAFLWQNGAMTDIGTLPGDVMSWAETINSKSQAVGTSFDASGNMHPFVWQNGVMTNLNSLIPSDSPWLLLEALGNNDRGQIVGYGLLTTTGEIHAYVATPCNNGNAGVGSCNDGTIEASDIGSRSRSSSLLVSAAIRTLPQSLMRQLNRYHPPNVAMETRSRITGFSPTSGKVGTVVEIHGRDLQRTKAVTFSNGVNASFAVDSRARVTTTVPAGAVTGVIAITTPHRVIESQYSFGVVEPPPPRLPAVSSLMCTGLTGRAMLCWFSLQPHLLRTPLWF